MIRITTTAGLDQLGPVRAHKPLPRHQHPKGWKASLKMRVRMSQSKRQRPITLTKLNLAD
jgi:hypothetical protein